MRPFPSTIRIPSEVASRTARSPASALPIPAFTRFPNHQSQITIHKSQITSHKSLDPLPDLVRERDQILVGLRRLLVRLEETPGPFLEPGAKRVEAGRLHDRVGQEGAGGRRHLP